MITIGDLIRSGDKRHNRFSSKVVVESNGCWIWKGASRRGYGVFWADGRNHAAHRWIYGQFKKTQKNYVICHRCDNPLCVNPSHLFQATQQTNMKDAARKRRLSNRKLTESQKYYIRKSSEPDYIMAQKFGVWETTIRRTRRQASVV